MTRRIPWLLALLCVSALPASAQTQSHTPSRADAALEQRQGKAAQPVPFRPGKVERFLTLVENGSLLTRLSAPTDGFGVRVGGIERGAGFALGPVWRRSSLFDGNLQVSVSAARSIAGDSEVDLGVAAPHLGTHRLALAVEGVTTRLAQERFFGMGIGSQRGDQTAYGVKRQQVTAGVTFAATRWLQLAGGGGVLTTTTASARARLFPSIETRFGEADAAGLGRRPQYSTASLAATIDYRDLPQNPRTGGRYHLAVSRYADRLLQRYSFTRIDTEVEQHLSVWKRQRTLTVRGLAAATFADRGQQVPFYLQPTLGGSRVLRGFVTDRFVDQNMVAVQVEYGWDLLPFLSAVAFAEAGTVAPRWQDLSARDLRKDYGLGFRFGSARTVALRTDVAFGSGEGTRLTMRFNHAF